nr:hypothetical protein CFP56_21002 [Quercus suber]
MSAKTGQSLTMYRFMDLAGFWALSAKRDFVVQMPRTNLWATGTDWGSGAWLAALETLYVIYWELLRTMRRIWLGPVLAQSRLRWGQGTGSSGGGLGLWGWGLGQGTGMLLHIPAVGGWPSHVGYHLSSLCDIVLDDSADAAQCTACRRSYIAHRHAKHQTRSKPAA